MALLQRERRVSYWALKQEFGLDDAFIEGLKQELIVARRVAIDEGGQVLIWTGETSLRASQAVVQSTQAAAVTAMQPWDGYVAQYLGDGLLVYFGWPPAHEDAAVRAVHASLALLAALKPFNETQLAPRYGVRVQVRLGLQPAWQ
jgi:class 3 adenylate cyclase